MVKKELCNIFYLVSRLSSISIKKYLAGIVILCGNKPGPHTFPVLAILDKSEKTKHIMKQNFNMLNVIKDKMETSLINIHITIFVIVI